MFKIFLALPLVLATCMSDETVSGFIEPNGTYLLSEINGEPFPASASISFPEKGSVRGKSPCNSFAAEQSAPYPWLKISPIRSTMLACRQKAEERLFFQTLVKMTQVEAEGDLLILRNDENDEMVFRIHQP